MSIRHETADQQNRSPNAGKRHPILRWALLFASTTLLAWSGWQIFTPSPPSSDVPSLPDLTLEHLNGEPFRLQDATGHPLVVNLWATWCPPCRQELPLLEHAANTRRGVRFLFIDQGENRDRVQDFLTERELGLEGVLLDPESRASQAFQSKGMPTTLFFNARGELVATHLGELTEMSLDGYLAQLK
ncbi:MAG: TlpA family protein disulfide reductase [Trueperaceae bacterium]|nr:MAG: TlpA family protein disulfide reductase [Trueperaceae bacterium]